MRPDDLAGDITATVHQDSATGLVAVRVRQRLATHQVAAQVPISAELWNDSAVDLTALFAAALDRRLRPWRYPDPNPMPMFDPFPRFTRWAHLWRKR